MATSSNILRVDVQANATTAIDGQDKATTAIDGQAKATKAIDEQADAATTIDGQTNATTAIDGQANGTTAIDGQANATTTLDGQANATTTLDGQANATTAIDGQANGTTTLDGQTNARTALDGQANATTTFDGQSNASTTTAACCWSLQAENLSVNAPDAANDVSLRAIPLDAGATNGEARGRSVVIFLHGLGGTGEGWLDFLGKAGAYACWRNISSIYCTRSSAIVFRLLYCYGKDEIFWKGMHCEINFLYKKITNICMSSPLYGYQPVQKEW